MPSWIWQGCHPLSPGLRGARLQARLPGSPHWHVCAADRGMQLIEIPHARAAGEPAMRDVELGIGEERQLQMAPAENQSPGVMEDHAEPGCRVEGHGRIQVPRGQVGVARPVTCSRYLLPLTAAALGATMGLLRRRGALTALSPASPPVRGDPSAPVPAGEGSLSERTWCPPRQPPPAASPGRRAGRWVWWRQPAGATVGLPRLSAREVIAQVCGILGGPEGADRSTSAGRLR